MSTFEALDQHTVRELAHRLAQRVEERFPTRGLTQAAKSLAGYSDLVAEETKALGAKNFLLQGVLALLALVGIGAVIYVARGVVDVSASRSFTLAEFLQSLDATFNIVILTTLALAFVLNQAKRKKQKRALMGLHALRSMAHVIDMHQLNKDPAALVSGLERTRSSPARDLTPAEMLRYLDYCSEMLSVVSKLAALYAQFSRDPLVIDTVNDVEQLTSSLSNKIWQKIIITQSLLGGAPAFASVKEAQRAYSQ